MSLLLPIVSWTDGVLLIYDTQAATGLSISEDINVVENMIPGLVL